MESWDGSYRDPATREVAEQVDREEREPDSHETARSVLDDYNTAIAMRAERSLTPRPRPEPHDLLLDCLIDGHATIGMGEIQDDSEIARTVTAMIRSGMVEVDYDVANFCKRMHLTKLGEITMRAELRRYREREEAQRQEREAMIEQVKTAQQQQRKAEQQAVADSKRSKRVLDLD